MAYGDPIPNVNQKSAIRHLHGKFLINGRFFINDEFEFLQSLTHFFTIFETDQHSRFRLNKVTYICILLVLLTLIFSLHHINEKSPHLLKFDWILKCN